MKLSNNQTETEQLYEKMTDKAEEQTQEPEEVEISEQAEETSDQADDEEILSEEEREIQREIEAYQAKIAEIDEKLAEYSAKKVDDDKRKLMRKWHYTDEQIDRYIKFIDGETSEEIKQSIAELTKDIPPAGDNFADPSPMNHAKQKPAPADPSEVGKSLFERIKHRIWGGGATL